MAKPLTLQERIEKSRTLAQQSTDQLAAERGLVTPPVTAQGVGGLGGTKQQQAMAGTPAQKGAVLAATQVAAPAAETGLELAQKVRPQQAVDLNKQQTMQRFAESLGTFGNKVNEMVDGAFRAITGTIAADNKLAGGIKATLVLTPEQKKAIDDQKKTLSEIQRGAIDAALTVLSTQGQTPEAINKAILDLNTNLGNTTTESLLAGTAFDSYWQNIKESTARQLETGVQGKLLGPDSKLTLQDITALGTSWPEVASLLGKTPAEVQNMTIGQLQDNLAQVGQQQFGATATVAATMASPLASAAERKALVNVMRDLESSGIAGAEMQYQKLLQDVDAGKTVQVAGKDYTLDQLLAQGTLFDLAMSFYDTTKADEVKKLAAEEPALYQWLTENADTLVAIRESNTKGVEALKQHNIKADEARVKFKGTALEKLLPKEYLTGSVIPTDKVLTWDAAGVGQGIADIMKMTDPGQQTQAIENFSGLYSAAEAAGATPEDIAALKNLTGAELSNGDFVGRMKKAWADWATSQAIKNDPLGLLNLLLGEDVTDIAAINSELVADDARAMMGLATSGWSQLDKNNNNVLDLEEIQSMAGQLIARPTVDSVRQGAGSQADSLRPAGGAQPSITMKPVFDAILNDGKLEPQELSGLSLDTMAAIFNETGRPGEQAGVTLSPLQSAIRTAYVNNALPTARRAGYQGKGLDDAGFTAGLSGLMADVDTRWGQARTGEDFRRLLPSLEDTTRKLSANVGALEQLAKDTTNEDLRWLIDQDLNKARQALDKYNKLLPQGKLSAMTPMEKVVNGIAVAAEEVRDYITKNTEVIAGVTPEAKRQLERAAGMEPGTLDRPATQAKQTAGTVAQAVQTAAGTLDRPATQAKQTAGTVAQAVQTAAGTAVGQVKTGGGKLAETGKKTLKKYGIG